MQIIAVSNLGKKGFNTRTGQKCGTLPYVDHVQPTPALIPGFSDVNSDGKVDAQDYITIKRAVIGTVDLTAEQKAVADVNCNSKLTAADYLISKRIVLGTYKRPDPTPADIKAFDCVRVKEGAKTYNCKSRGAIACTKACSTSSSSSATAP